MSRKQFASDILPGEDFSRREATYRYSAQRRRRGKRWKALLVLLGVVVALALVVVGFSVYGLGVQAHLRAGLPDDIGVSLSESAVSEPFYLLVVGVDDGVPELGEDPSSKRADMLVLARVDASKKKLTLVSILRDTLIDLGASGKQRIAATYSIGGATYTAKITSQFAGVPVAHYLELDLTQLDTIVDTVGGVEVDVPAAVTDQQTGANLQAGEQTLNGEQAQQLCRARHGYADEANAENYRTASQRLILASLLQKVLDQNPLAMLGTLSDLAGSVSCSMDLLSVASLASNFKGFSPLTNLLTGQNPYEIESVDGVDWVVTNRTAWREMMLRVGQGLAPYEPGEEPVLESGSGASGLETSSGGTEDKSATSTLPLVPPVYEGTVRILNASSTNGLAAAASDVLENAGFETSTATASEMSDSSVIIYANPLDEGKAVGVADALETGIEIRANDGSYSMSTDVLVILGKDQVM